MRAGVLLEAGWPECACPELRANAMISARRAAVRVACSATARALQCPRRHGWTLTGTAASVRVPIGMLPPVGAQYDDRSSGTALNDFFPEALPCWCKIEDIKSGHRRCSLRHRFKYLLLNMVWIYVVQDVTAGLTAILFSPDHLKAYV